MSSTRELVLARLRKEKIKLWLPPYHDPPARGGGAANDEALSKLARSLRDNFASSPDPKRDEDASGPPPEDEILDVLRDLQNHAVRKLREKNSLDVKIIASEGHLANLPEGGAALAAFLASWGGEVAILDVDRGRGSLLLRVVDLSPELTVDAFASDVCRALDAKTARVIWRGRNLTSAGGSRLRFIASGDGGAEGMASNQKKRGELLCLVSGFGCGPPASSAAASASGPAPAAQTESSVIESIREAASTIQKSTGGSRFEVTDQRGNLVPMSQGDSVAFLTALGLHRIGRSKLESRDDDDGGGREAAASALVFLLEADAEWNNSPALEAWRSKVDNYGLLQLDIAWCFLLLESLDDLTDAVRRLGVAEQALTKQVHVNFVTLALAQAEMGGPIPPLCSIFARLFLLQGVANRIRGRDAGATERLGWARILCDRLRSSSPPDHVEALRDAYFVDASAAIAALRRSDGDPDAAGNFIANGREEERTAARKRRRQHRIGRCANGADYVNLDLVPTLSGLLGFDDAADVGEGGAESTSALIVTALLRLSNNVIDDALELYASVGAERALEQAARLDVGRKKRQAETGDKSESPRHAVQDVDLAVLVSMGVDESRCRRALEAAGNVDDALLWLSGDCPGEDAGAAEREDAGEDDTKDAAGSAAQDGSDGGSGDNDADSNLESEGSTVDNAYEILERELGNALSANSRQLLEKDWLGADLQDEWDLIQKYF